jgi:hypothetical protein
LFGVGSVSLRQIFLLLVMILCEGVLMVSVWWWCRIWFWWLPWWRIWFCFGGGADGFGGWLRCWSWDLGGGGDVEMVEIVCDGFSWIQILWSLFKFVEVCSV